MRFQDIRRRIADVPFITLHNARFLYDLILDHKITNILELGIAHGAATCHMAAALEELGRGTITAVDLAKMRNYFQPSAEALIKEHGFENIVEIHRMQTGYTWFLHDEIRRQSVTGFCEPVYDLCIIDGPKNWTIDGCAFFLADKLLKENGWIIFDDYLWTYAGADHREQTDGITHRELSEAERTTPQVREIFELLVTQHPSYSDFRIHEKGDWAIARKTRSDTKTYTIDYRKKHDTALRRLARSIRRKAA